MNTIKGAKRVTAKEVRLLSKKAAARPVIKDKSAYQQIMAEIERLMNKGSKNVTANELAKIRSLAVAAQAYEKKTFVIEPPTTLGGVIEMKMHEMRLKQKDLAEKLNISTAKLSLILNGRQKPDVAFLKAVYTELHIDAKQLLEMAIV